METVNKPWGYEKWLHQGKYVFKEIFMKAGCQSSLQYHKEKEENNYIVRGVVELTVDGETTRLTSGYSFHINPGERHRVKAITDILMVEASTPEVDDVIRIRDDYDRPDGRIESEHKR